MNNNITWVVTIITIITFMFNKIKTLLTRDIILLKVPVEIITSKMLLTCIAREWTITRYWVVIITTIIFHLINPMINNKELGPKVIAVFHKILNLKESVPVTLRLKTLFSNRHNIRLLIKALHLLTTHSLQQPQDHKWVSKTSREGWL